MSACIVDPHVIRYLLEAALSSPRTWASPHRAFSWFHNKENHLVSDNNASEIGQMLLDENAASFTHRYADLIPTLDHDPLAAVDPYNHIRIRPFDWDPIQTIKTVDYFDYQSSEHHEWEGCKAKAFLDDLRAAA